MPDHRQLVFGNYLFVCVARLREIESYLRDDKEIESYQPENKKATKQFSVEPERVSPGAPDYPYRQDIVRYGNMQMDGDEPMLNQLGRPEVCGAVQMYAVQVEPKAVAVPKSRSANQRNEIDYEAVDAGAVAGGSIPI